MWSDAKAALRTALGTVAITSPSAVSIKSVYAEPPPSIDEGMVPAIVIGDSSFDDEWASGLALESYEVECFMMFRLADVVQAIPYAEAWRQAIKSALRSRAKLGRAEVTLQGGSYGRLTTVDYAGKSFDGFTFTLRMTINDEAPGFAAG